MDPFRREMHLSLGCALENAVLIARSLGYDAGLRISGGFCRRVECAMTRVLPPPSAGQAAGGCVALMAAIPIGTRIVRHIGRTAIFRSTSSVSSALASDTAVRLTWLTDPAARRDFAAATVAATETITTDAVMIADSDRWFRATDAEIELHRDGPTLYCAGLTLGAAGCAIDARFTQSAHRH